MLQNWFKKIRASFFAVALLLSWSPRVTAQLIQPAQDGTGTVVTNANPNQFEIRGGTQAGSNLFHSFDQFGLTQGQMVNFLSRPDITDILGRVTGGNASIVNGLLQVSGGNSNLYLINPAGILFGPNAQLNLPASFTATTASGVSLGQNWFKAVGIHDYATLTESPTTFAFLGSGSLVNAGKLTVGQGRDVTLLGGTVVNTGTITAPSGNITIAAIPDVQMIRVSQAGQLLSLELPLATKAMLQPTTALSLPALLTGGNLNEASSITVENGLVKIGNTPISSAQGVASISGQLNARQIQGLGSQVHLVNATLNASAAQGGGTISIGGNYQGQGTTPRARSVLIDTATQIQANALTQGGGGQVVVWADETAIVQGTITARGISQGGTIETSGRKTLDTTGIRVDAGSVQGQPGTWLLDPTDITIANNGGTITPAAIASTLNSGTNVSLTTDGVGAGNGDITLTDSITTQTVANTASLTLTGRQFSNPTGASISMASTGGLTFNLNQVNPQPIAPTDSIQNSINAIGSVAGSRTIRLAAGSYSGNTITIDRPLTLNGAGASSTTLNGNNAYRVLFIPSDGKVTLDGLTIAQGNSGSFNGGGIYYGGTGQLDINNSSLTNNTAQNAGGILAFSTGAVNISNSTISNNVAQFNGGGIVNSRSKLIISNSTLSSNRADNGGGILNSSITGTSINNSTLSNNIVTGSGGGIFNQFVGTLNINNSTISNNQASSGGGVFNTDSGTASINNSTLSGNSATAGGGINNQVVDSVNLGNSLVAGNSASFGREISGPFISTGYNLFGFSGVNGLSTGSPLLATDIVPTVPLNQIIAPLGNNGGSTQTVALVAGSPAIDAGNNLGSATLIDQRGAQRAPAGINAGTRIDIGAYEATSSYVVTSQLDNNAIGSLRSAINFANVNINPSTTSPLQTIRFNIGALSSSNTIDLTAALPIITQSTNLDGWTQGGTDYRGVPLITINGNNQFRGFSIAGSGPVTLNGLAIVQGNSGVFNDGGGIAYSGSDILTVSNSILANNSARSRGGGITNNATGTINISNSTLSGNSAQSGGGIANITTGAVNIIKSTLVDNLAQFNGGGVANTMGTVNISNSTFSGNSAQSGGGIANATGTVNVRNSTLSGNFAQSNGGGIFNSETGITNITSSLMTGNNAPTGREIAGNFTSQGYNLFGASGSSGLSTSAIFGTDIVPKVPSNQILAPLNNYGGPTQTHALLPGSPAINSGDPAAPALDQRDLPRVGLPDIGAVESQGYTLTAGTPQTTIVNTAFTNPLAVKVTANNLSEPISGGVITYKAPESGASLNIVSQTAAIAADGTAQLPITANTKAGSYTVTATAAGVSNTANFSLTNQPTAPRFVTVVGGNSQTTTVNTPFNQVLQVIVVDRFNNPVPNAAVSLQLPASGASGLFSNGSSTIVLSTDQNGTIQTQITANNTPGEFVGNANVNGIPIPASFTLLNRPTPSNLSPIVRLSIDPQIQLNQDFRLVREELGESAIPITGPDSLPQLCIVQSVSISSSSTTNQGLSDCASATSPVK